MPAIWCRSNTRWCDGCGSTATPVTQARRPRSGSPGPSYYEAAAAVDRDGLGGLVPAKPGPRRAHKLTDEVIAYARQLREADPARVGAAGRCDRREVRDHGCTRDRWSGPWPALRTPKVEGAITSTIPAVMDPTSWTAMSSCGPARLPAQPTGGGWGWAVLQQRGAGRMAAAAARRPSPRCRRPRLPRPAPPLAEGVEAELVGLLAVDGAGRRHRKVSGV